jgi:AbrB family looped-hinge helix DNA binding protein
MNYVHIPVPVNITVSTKGQIVIPKEFRLAAGLETGAKVTLFCHEDGSLELRPLRHSISELKGVAKKYARKQSDFMVDKCIMEQILMEDEQTKSDKKSDNTRKN